MQTNFSYRDATIEDIEQLKVLGWASYGVFAPQLDPDQAEKLRKNVSSNETWISLMDVARGFVCLNNGKIIGMAFFIPKGNPWDIFGPEWSYIRMLGVDPAYQGKGIARTLTGMCIAEAKRTGNEIIALHTSEMMHAARHIYESLGFKVLKEIAPRLGKRYWIYTLDLGS